MNNTSMSRRPAGPVRQHSLQQPPRRQQQQQIRRQRSTEDEKNLQIYSTGSIGSRNNNRFAGNNASKFDHHHHHYHNNHHHHQVSMLERPTVRVAWSEQSTKLKNDSGVEIVARQIPTGKSSRPTTGRGNRGTMGRCPLAEKATILYSRQELAERLRLAWRQREENKSNIDIFLAHNTVEERCDSRMSSGTSRTALSTPLVQRKNEEENLNDIQTQQSKETRKNEVNEELKCEEPQKLDAHKYQTWFTSFESSECSTVVSEDQVIKVDAIKAEEYKENNETAAEEEKEEEEEEEEEEEVETVVEKKSSISINCNDWNTSITINNKTETTIDNQIKIPSTPPTKDAPDYSQARLKRASYQSGLNKAFVGPILEKPSTPRINSRVNSFQQEHPLRFRRTSSAPPPRRTQVNIVIDAPAIVPSRTADNEPVGRAMSATSEPFNQLAKSSITASRPIKSAPPVKRRSKASKRRGLSMGYSKDGGEDGKEDEDSRGKTKGLKGGKNALETKNTADVVTMVSLVSSADSESEMDENSPRDDKLICELRNKLPTTPIIKSSNGLSGGIRKPFKSVSFQQDSFDYDSPPRLESETTSTSSSAITATRATSLQARFVALSRANASSPDCGSSTPLLTAATMTMSAWSKTEICATPMAPLLQLQQHAQQQQQQLKNSGNGLQEAPTTHVETPLTDREKRCLAVPIGDIHDKKRKLVRCRSAVAAPRLSDAEKQQQQQLSATSQTCLQADMRMSQIAGTQAATVGLQESNTSKVITIPLMPTTETSVEKDKNVPAEPYCQTPKEKECWYLYRRMCDKGVFVSFDTVLRGMLTPTEYRLRQKEMSQNC